MYRKFIISNKSLIIITEGNECLFVEFNISIKNKQDLCPYMRVEQIKVKKIIIVTTKKIA